MGRKQVAADCLTILLERTDVEVVGVLTDSHLQGSVTESVARAADIPVYTFDTALEAMRDKKLNYDIGFSMLYWRKLKYEFLSIPKYGCVNFHPAPLPDYKGVGGYNLAILEGLSTWAVSAHYVDSEIDTGPIIAVHNFPISPNDETAQTLERKSQKYLENIFVDTVGRLINNSFDLVTSPNLGGRYLSRSGLEAMKKIDLDDSELDRKVRAFWFPPYDGAYVEAAGERYTLVSQQMLKGMADPNASSLFSGTTENKSEKC